MDQVRPIIMWLRTMSSITAETLLIIRLVQTIYVQRSKISILELTQKEICPKRKHDK